jgi:hypothetical protein
VQYFNVNFDVSKKIYYALVGIINYWTNQNARHSCGKKRTQLSIDFFIPKFGRQVLYKIYKLWEGYSHPKM